MNGLSRESNPSKIISLSFFGAILAGALLLKLPVSQAGEPVRFIDALFISTSAICVTGLATIDIGTQFSRFGQTVVLLLIQAGGLGIMTFSLFFFMLLGKKTSLTDRLAVSSLARHRDAVHLIRALFFIFVMTLAVECLGAALLFLRFRDLLPRGEALFYSIFHAVSAFCNAGFGLYSDSLTRFQRELFVPGVVMALIVLGGIGFIVVHDVGEKIKSGFLRTSFRLSFHTQVVMVMTVFLILFGAVVIWILESSNLLKGLPALYQFSNALFLSVTPRTAGFNTIATGELANGTLFFVIMLMFIGAAPGSTAGGIKVTTFAVLLALIKAQIQGREMTSMLKKKVPQDVIAKSLAIFAASFILVNAVTLLLQLTEKLGNTHLLARGNFLDLLFETVSAFGTVGLSTGVTPLLSDAGKLLIIVTMFIGRVGPLTLGLAIMLRRRRQVHFEYAEEDVMIG